MSRDPEQYANEVCKRRLAGICAALGWNSMTRTSMDILVDLLRTYTIQLGKDMKQVAELCDRTHVTALDASMALTHGHTAIDTQDLTDYLAVVKVGSVLAAEPVAKFPREVKSDLNFLKPGSREVLVRKVHVNDYFPPMFPDMEDDANGGGGEDRRDGQDKEEADKAQAEAQEDTSAPLTAGAAQAAPASESHRQVREMTSVMMTTGGFISPAREGKLPESRSLPPHVLKPEPVAPSARLPQADPSLEEGRDVSAQNAAKLSVFAKKAQTKAQKLKEAKAALRLKQQQQQQERAVASHAAYDDSIGGVIKRGVKESEEIDERQQMIKAAAVMQPAMPKTPRIPKKVKTAPGGTPAAVAAGAGGGRGRKRKRETVVQAISKEIVPSSDSDSSPERRPAPVSVTPPVPVEKPKSIEEQIARNPLIPQQLYGFPDPDAPSTSTSSSQATPAASTSKTAPPGEDDDEKEEGQIDDSDEDDDALPAMAKKSKDKEKDRSSKKNKPSKKKKEKHEKGSKKAAKKDKEKKRKREDRRESSSITPSPAPSPVPPSPMVKIIAQPKRPKEEKKPIPKIKIKTDKKPVRPSEPGLFDPSQAPVVLRRAGVPAAVPPPAKVKEVAKPPPPAKAPVFKPMKEKKKEKPAKKTSTSSSSSAPKKVREKRPTVAPPAPSTSAPPPAPVETGIVTRTVGSFIDDEGNQVWFCPGCGKQDDGIIPMIGCDGCDDWYHWPCVGIMEDPGDNQDWFCGNCARRSREWRSRR